MKSNKQVHFQDLKNIPFKAAWDLQEELLNANVQTKLENRRHGLNNPTKHHFLFCEHPHVYTLGKSGNSEHLLIPEHLRKDQNIEYFKINRGGDITYHGPGQIVGYPILDLELFFTDIHKYLRLLEEVIILTLNEYGVQAERYEGYTGVWIDADQPTKARKICAMGVRCSRWVTMHGFALNVNTDLSFFDHIVPCGIKDKQVTSLRKELGMDVDIVGVKQKIINHFQEIFEAEMIFKGSQSLIF
ncbi:MAG: lipoyl(octanoyl) transferase LipB [Flavobacteriales bacterium]|nr:lipoyl(octanoyl) transferase LipB [Flavobacteriales bacterium]